MSGTGEVEFVNPYTFVPFPESPPQRCAPHGHLGHPDLLSGTLQVRVTAQTPLLVRDISRQAGDAEPRLPRRPDGTVLIPGSSWKGALRSLHETLTGSCLRIFDPDFLPTYRDAASSSPPGELRMAVVHEHAGADQPPVLQLCESGTPATHRLSQKQLESLNQGQVPLTSGARLDITFDEDGKPDTAEHNAEGAWMVLLSESRARQPSAEYRAHVRKLTSETMQVSAAGWERYLAEADDADELREQSIAQGADEHYLPVEHPHRANKPDGERVTLGRRYRVTKHLRRGQPMWVRIAGGRIISVQHGMLWRHRGGDTPSGGRIPAKFGPCRNDRELCPSCRMFGSADTEATPRGTPAADRTTEQQKAEQRSYAGHIRFGDALADGEVPELAFELAPLGSPNPGAGQFYLVNQPDAVGNVGDPPLREWGSSADRGEKPRKLRGRKKYWHTELGEERLPARGQAREHQKESQLARRAVAIPRGTELTMTISFTDLDEVQLGSLLATLQPGELLNEQVWQHIGGGRPLGFGSCTLAVDTAASAVWRSGARYGGGTDVSLDIAHFTGVFQEWVQRELPAVHETWPALTSALDPKAVDPDAVWYPPGASRATRGTKEYDDGFEFWKQTSGEQAKTKKRGPRTGHPLIPLPEATSEDQTLRYTPKANPRTVSRSQPPGVPHRPNGSNKPNGGHGR
ncbi:TIGR03986 family CRISPR-associated RAMP protein [Saccharopolyspora sp. HNM0983]|uniref:TIGR03986 family CRISPR-associated RAMP protein n=1 Tax=Saccharopolyspora montiporae TaxID=2781240 RepID=A0A929G0Y8_9PSEU|nr:TIGR03986 family CRISPR-associated RAMP protein [Saccharopolyspora sp. HNM0983]